MRWLDGITESTDISYKFEQTQSEGQGSLARYSSWGCKALDTTW